MLIDLDKKYPGLRKSLTKPFTKNINPNIITYFAFIFAVIAGYCFYKNEIFIGSLIIAASLYLDVLDGAIAKTFGATKFGDFLDHTLDRLSDVFIFVGLALNPNYNTALVFITLLSVIMVSYMGTQAHALIKERVYGGLLGRADRVLILIITGLLTVIYTNALLYGIYIILILSVITFFQRYYATHKVLKREYKSKKK